MEAQTGSPGYMVIKLLIRIIVVYFLGFWALPARNIQYLARQFHGGAHNKIHLFGMLRVSDHCFFV